MSNFNKAVKRVERTVLLTALAVLSTLSSQGANSADAKMPTVKFGDHIVKLEVASTPEEIEKGLMFRTSLPEEQGMVFLFQPPRKVNFWMYHCFISLDMVFIKNGKVVHIFHDVPPCKEEDPQKCPLYPGGEGIDVSEVIELKAGYATRHHVKPGDAVHINME